MIEVLIKLCIFITVDNCDNFATSKTELSSISSSSLIVFYCSWLTLSKKFVLCFLSRVRLTLLWSTYNCLAIISSVTSSLFSFWAIRRSNSFWLWYNKPCAFTSFGSSSLKTVIKIIWDIMRLFWLGSWLQFRISVSFSI